MEITGKSVVVDTNIWIYFLNKDSPYHKKARGKVADLLGMDYSIFVTTQIIREIFVVLTKGELVEKPVEVKKALTKVSEILESVNIIYENNESLEILTGLIAKYKLKGKKIHDANVVAVALANNIKHIFTNNVDDFKFFTEVKILTF
uniref:PIN domain-containing protein n=1 Tax=candidate division WOR-3 bacterium TaxID=2052148 RepID=A0A7C4X7V9_UNCW3